MEMCPKKNRNRNITNREYTVSITSFSSFLDITVFFPLWAVSVKQISTKTDVMFVKMTVLIVSLHVPTLKRLISSSGSPLHWFLPVSRHVPLCLHTRPAMYMWNCVCAKWAIKADGCLAASAERETRESFRAAAGKALWESAELATGLWTAAQ